MTRRPFPVPDNRSVEAPQRIWSFRWRDGPEEIASGRTAAMAALSLGYGFDDFLHLTWEERG